MDLLESEISDETAARHPWEEARYKVVLDLIKANIRDKKKKELEILDVGCGDVWLIEQLSKELLNTKFTAVDTAFTDKLIDQFKERLDPDRFRIDSDLNRAVQNIEEVDLVLLLDVIEHIESEVEFLDDLIENTSTINNDTTFLITVPAFQTLFSEHDHFLKHYRRYSKKGLQNALERAGLEVEQSGYFFSSLILPRLLIKILEALGIKKGQAKGIGSHQKGTFDPFIRNTLIFDYKLGRLMRKMGLGIAGLSAFAIAKPKVKTQKS